MDLMMPQLVQIKIIIGWLRATYIDERLLKLERYSCYYDEF